jgi:hypothetical protein
MMSPEFLSAVAAGRWDIYGLIHKAIRMAHGDMMTRLAQADFSLDQDALLNDLEAHLHFGAKHLAHEEDYIHGPLEQHEHHRARFGVLTSAIAALRHAAPADRPTLARALYLAFTAFVAEDLNHMRQEETEIWPLLCAHFTDEELQGLEMAIIGSLSPDENLTAMRLMLPALNRPERTALLQGINAGAPPEAYAALVDLAARPTLCATELGELERLGLAA